MIGSNLSFLVAVHVPYASVPGATSIFSAAGVLNCPSLQRRVTDELSHRAKRALSLFVSVGPSSLCRQLQSRRVEFCLVFGRIMQSNPPGTPSHLTSEMGEMIGTRLMTGVMVTSACCLMGRRR